MRTATRKRASLCVGILTVPHSNSYGHIMKSYVDWFENYGIRVVPIPYHTSNPAAYCSIVNGLFIPGTDRGYDVTNRAFMRTLRAFVSFSTKPNVYFPIWGTCFGMEVLLKAIGRIRTFSHPADGRHPIRVYASRMMQSFSNRFVLELEETKSTVQNHDYGISVQEMHRHPILRGFFRVAATSLDENGKEYVAAMEAYRYPIYGVQFHPERLASNRPFLEFFQRELARNPVPVPVVHPRIHTVVHARRCREDGKTELCYFFS